MLNPIYQTYLWLSLKLFTKLNLIPFFKMIIENLNILFNKVRKEKR